MGPCVARALHGNQMLQLVSPSTLWAAVTRSISFLSCMGTLPRAGDGRDDAGARGRLGPRRRSCQRRKVSRVVGGGDVVLSGVRHTPRRIPGPRTEIKGRGRSKLLLKCPLPTPEAPGWGGSVAHVSWTPSLPYPVILTILVGVWDGAST